MGDKETLKINDKYTIVLDQDVSFKFYATRNGKQWRDLTGDNLILAMFQNLTTITQQYNAVVSQNKSLQGELLISKKMIELMAKNFMFYAICPKARNEKEYINNIKVKALQELEAEND